MPKIKFFENRKNANLFRLKKYKSEFKLSLSEETIFCQPRFKTLVFYCCGGQPYKTLIKVMAFMILNWERAVAWIGVSKQSKCFVWELRNLAPLPSKGDHNVEYYNVPFNNHRMCCIFPGKKGQVKRSYYYAICN